MANTQIPFRWITVFLHCLLNHKIIAAIYSTHFRTLVFGFLAFWSMQQEVFIIISHLLVLYIQRIQNMSISQINSTFILV